MFNTPITLGRLCWWLILGSLMPVILLVACVGLGFALGALSGIISWCGHHLILVGFFAAVGYQAAKRTSASNAEPTDA